MLRRIDGKRRSGLRGVTLWELICVTAILSLIASFAVPSFEKLVLDSRQAVTIRTFVSAVQLARTEAATRHREIVLCPSADLRRCAEAEAGFDAGWIVFENTDEAHPSQRDADEPLLRAERPVMQGSIRANRAAFEFRAFRRRSTNGTVTFCDRRGSEQARAVIVSYTGRPRISRLGPGEQALDCPAA
jgi:type IV fimbrial biogenesis protein FimT